LDFPVKLKLFRRFFTQLHQLQTAIRIRLMDPDPADLPVSVRYRTG
jgi:hypothetical protein